MWAGETMYSAHRLVLALSSHYFRLVVTGVSGEGKHPVIFLKVKITLSILNDPNLSPNGFIIITLSYIRHSCFLIK